MGKPYASVMQYLSEHPVILSFALDPALLTNTYPKLGFFSQGQALHADDLNGLAVGVVLLFGRVKQLESKVAELESALEERDG